MKSSDSISTLTSVSDDLGSVLTVGKCSLFLGDLGIYCKEEDLHEKFSPFGEVLDIKIMRNQETNRNLSYGFIKFRETQAAQRAMDTLNGVIMHGRPLRIRWATYKSKIAARENRESIETSPVHVSFISYQAKRLVTEESLRILFSKYGEVLDVSIKKSTIEEDISCQSGYGFVHFGITPDGIESAISAVTTLNDCLVEDVKYKCNISHHLGKRRHGQPADPEPTGPDPRESLPVHVSFISYQTKRIVTEDYLKLVFTKLFGEVLYVDIRLCTFEKDRSFQSGYGFVHFGITSDGIESAIAVTTLNDILVEDVNFKCNIPPCAAKRSLSPFYNDENYYSSDPYANLPPNEAYTANDPRDRLVDRRGFDLRDRTLPYVLDRRPYPPVDFAGGRPPLPDEYHARGRYFSENPYARDPYMRDPYARDSYARDPYARDPRNPYARDPRDPYTRDPRDPYARDPRSRYGPDAYGPPPSYDAPPPYPPRRGYPPKDPPYDYSSAQKADEQAKVPHMEDQFESQKRDFKQKNGTIDSQAKLLNMNHTDSYLKTPLIDELLSLSSTSANGSVSDNDNTKSKFIFEEDKDSTKEGRIINSQRIRCVLNILKEAPDSHWKRMFTGYPTTVAQREEKEGDTKVGSSGRPTAKFLEKIDWS